MSIYGRRQGQQGRRGPGGGAKYEVEVEVEVGGAYSYSYSDTVYYYNIIYELRYIILYLFIL